jgi:ribosome recycling factor
MNLSEYQKDFDKAIEFFKTDILGLRTGRATNAIVEDVIVEAYGTKQPIKALATIMVADAKTVNIEPWDKSLVGNIEKAIRDAGLGLNPINDGRLIRLILPELTVERRNELIKVLHQKQENVRISIRKIREDIKDVIVNAEKNNEIAEDEKYRSQEALDELVKKYNETIREIGENKEKEINTI